MLDRLLTLAACSLFFLAELPAQKKTDQASVKWGEDLTIKRDGEFQSVIGDVGNSTFLRVNIKMDRLIQRMDGLKMVWREPLDLEVDRNALTVERIILTANDILVFGSYYDKRDKENRLYLSSYEQRSFKPLKRHELLATIPADKASKAGTFLISASPERTKVLIQSIPPAEKGAEAGSRVAMYDAGMNLLWSQALQLPYSAEEFSVETQRADDDGTMLVIGVKYAQKREKRELKRADQATYEYHMLLYDGQSAKPQDHVIDAPDKFLQDMTIAIGTTGDIICAGLYGNKNSFSVRGAFFLRLDRSSKAIVHASYKEFSDDFITMYFTEKQEKMAKKKAEKKDGQLELPEFELRDLIRRDDGGAVLLAEQYMFRINYSTYTSNGQTYTTTNYHYYYNDLLVVNIDPQGNIEWATKVPKRQHSVNDGGRNSSYAVAVSGDRIHLIFNDTGKNLFLKPGDKVDQFSLQGKDALVVLATVDANGNTTREALFSPDRRDVILRPKDCVELEDGSMFIYASRKKDYRYGLIIFK